MRPPANRFGVTQEADPDERDDARLLNHVKGVVSVAQEPDGGGIQRWPVPLQQGSERFHLSGAGEGGQLGIAYLRDPHTVRMLHSNRKVRELLPRLAHQCCDSVTSMRSSS
jgi:hypothetical protein